MKFQKSIALAILLATVLNADASQYYIRFKGIKLGEINSLQTLNQHYLQAEVTNIIAKLMLRKKYFVFYEGFKPNINDAKFRKDKNKILFVLSEAITHRPAYKKYIINNQKQLILTCEDKQCHYIFEKKGRIAGKGLIEFDNANRFYKLTEQHTDVVIGRVK